MSSVENKIREMMSRKMDEAAYPGANQGAKDETAPMQGSSQKADIQTMHKGMDASKPANPVNALTANAGPHDASAHKQGSSEDAKIDSTDTQETQGKTQASKASKQPVPTTKGVGAAPNFTTVVDPSSVVNQATSKGNVYKEEEEMEEGEFISEEEYNALSDEEKAEYEAVELEESEEVEEVEEMEELDEKSFFTPPAGFTKSGMAKKGSKKEPMKSTTASKMKDDNAERRTVAMAAKARMKEELARDVETLLNSEVDLSEDFKTKAASIFEAVVTARVAHEMEQMEDILAEAAVEAMVEMQNEIVGNVDAYLSYVAEQWLEQNAVAVEAGLRAEVTEDFIAGLKVLFQEHYIEVPEEKYDVLGEMQAQIDELTAKLNETIAEAVDLNSALIESKRDVVFSKMTSDLAQTEAEKLRGLVEEIEFENEEIFEEKLKVIKNNYFPKNVSTINSLSEENTIEEISDSSVAKYVEVLSRRK